MDRLAKRAPYQRLQQGDLVDPLLKDKSIVGKILDKTWTNSKGRRILIRRRYGENNASLKLSIWAELSSYLYRVFIAKA